MAQENGGESVQLNLARKWRSRTFDQIVGQDVCVRMLKNSLYLGCYFPVYLFSGHRGSGKTSTARIFAAAVNCTALSAFQKNPKQVTVPCLTCESCQAMQAGKHPDFIEIDAASHTGVDNVRQIIDAASLLPLLGNKKIYLIDEAHMLSKAAFNAFLKILEEPPASALFMLATTESEKILDTIRSRCFQLFFRPIVQNSVLSHLEYVCGQEKIVADKDALTLIAQASQGAVRDALNLIEQARFSAKKITKDVVLGILGHIDDATIIQLFVFIVNYEVPQLIAFLRAEPFLQASPDYIWKRLLFYIRASLWLKQGVVLDELGSYHKQLSNAVARVTFAQLSELLDRFYEHEELFFRTADQRLFLEMFLLKLVMLTDGTNFGSGQNGSSAASFCAAEAPVDTEGDDEEDDDIADDEDAKSVHAPWISFLNEIEQLKDPLVSSLFKQAQFNAYDAGTGIVSVTFGEQLGFLQELLDQTEAVWLPVLQKLFGAHTQLRVTLRADGKQIPVVQEKQKSRVEFKNKEQAPVKQKEAVVESTKTVRAAPRYRSAQSIAIHTMRSNESKIDISDAHLWPMTHALLAQFPGTVYEVRSVNSGREL